MRLLCGSQNVQKMWDMSLEIILNGDYIMEYDYMPQLREADENGYIGIRGYLNFFQDAATRHMISVKAMIQSRSSTVYAGCIPNTVCTS